MIGVTQFIGRGVGVPTIVAQAVAVSALAIAVSAFAGVGSLVTITKVGVGVPSPGRRGSVGVTAAVGAVTPRRKTGPLPLESVP
jgi:hypothetical protein